MSNNMVKCNSPVFRTQLNNIILYKCAKYMWRSKSRLWRIPLVAWIAFSDYVKAFLKNNFTSQKHRQLQQEHQREILCWLVHLYFGSVGVAHHMLVNSILGGCTALGTRYFIYQSLCTTRFCISPDVSYMYPTPKDKILVYAKELMLLALFNIVSS